MHQRVLRLLTRLWPQTLSGRIAAILIIGMLAAQALTGAIWWEMRRGQLLEVPLRLVAARAADTALVLSALPQSERAGMAARLSSEDFLVRLLDQPPVDSAVSDSHDAQAYALIAQLLNERLKRDVPMRLLQLDLHGDVQPDGSRSENMLTAQKPDAEIRIALQTADGQWLEVSAQEGEIGYPVRPLHALADYVLRVYLLRGLVIVAFALLAVRLAMRPLKRMARAAEALGRDLKSPPLPDDGPREVRQAAQAFNAMQQQIMQGMEERTRFLAAVSHDLRSPITRLRLRAEMLEPEALRNKFRNDLGEMEHMVSSTLDMLTGAQANGPKQTIDMNALVHAVVQDMAEASGVEIPVTGHATNPFTGYTQSLRRCLQNLLENAQRYARDTEVLIDDDTVTSTLSITVRDHGPGIPETELAHVLEPFYRTEPSRNAKSGGVGLGLSIAQTVAAAHGGRLTLRNADDGGLVVTLELPR